MKKVKQLLAVAALSSVAFAAHADNSIKSTVELGAGWGSIVDGVHDSDRFAGSATAGLAYHTDKIMCTGSVGVRDSEGFTGAPVSAGSNDAMNYAVGCGMNFDKVNFTLGYRAHEYVSGNNYNVKGINVTVKGKMDKIGWLAGFQDAENTGSIWNAAVLYDLDAVGLSAEYVHRTLTDNNTKLRNIVLGANVGFEQFSTHEFAKHLSLNLGYVIDTGTTTETDGFAAGVQFKHQF